MSLLSVLLMVALFFSETWSFAHPTLRSSLEIDPEGEEMLELHFNVTLFDVHCDLVSVDVWDTLGTNEVNITKDVTRWHLDEQGARRKFHGHNTKPKPVKHERHEESLEEILAALTDEDGNRWHSAELTPDNIDKFYQRHPVAFVDFFAPWCIWCQRLAPTWEKFAAEARRRKLAVGVGKVDCVAHAELCKRERIMAFPTLRWIERGKAVMPDHKGDRTVDALADYAERRLGNAAKRKEDYDYGEDDEFHPAHHPGCQVSGHVLVQRVPGNLHLHAASDYHNVHAAMTNLTHRVNELSFGAPGGPGQRPDYLRWLDLFVRAPENTKRLDPLTGKLYPSRAAHQAFHHHLKVVASVVDFLFVTPVYQILAESQLLFYDTDEVPEIKFLWDMSPVSIVVTKEGKEWYEYLTSLLAIVGGTYTTLGLINRTLLRVFKPKRL